MNAESQTVNAVLARMFADLEPITLVCGEGEEYPIPEFPHNYASATLRFWERHRDGWSVYWLAWNIAEQSWMPLKRSILSVDASQREAALFARSPAKPAK